MYEWEMYEWEMYEWEANAAMNMLDRYRREPRDRLVKKPYFLHGGEQLALDLLTDILADPENVIIEPVFLIEDVVGTLCYAKNASNDDSNAHAIFASAYCTADRFLNEFRKEIGRC